MQENRSFDHYSGTLSGVRGFGDRQALRLASGRPVFAQPDPANPDGFLLPYHLDSATSAAEAIPSLSHAWQIQHASWNREHGRLAQRTHRGRQRCRRLAHGALRERRHPVPVRPGQCLHHLRQLFLLGARTDPSEPLHVDDRHRRPPRLNGGPALDNNAPPGTYNWTTTAERLENAGVTWKCYQQADNYGTNVLEFFSQFINAPTTSSLYQSAFGVSTLFSGGRPAIRPWPSRRTAPTAPSPP